jgi:cell wall-associated NlpC family hydrolase
MKKAFQVLFGISLFVIIWTQAPFSADAQVESRARRVKKDNLPPPKEAPKLAKSDFDSLFTPTVQRDYSLSQGNITSGKSVLLKSAIVKRLGVRYRYHGVDDRGYDCSGFIWSVFRDAGADFERVSARSLWMQLPKATAAETSQFGTLVFFRGTKHVGIIRDANSFYHASRSKGVTISYFDDYWRKRITGYRRAPKIDVSSLAQKLGEFGSWPVPLKSGQVLLSKDRQ